MEQKNRLREEDLLQELRGHALRAEQLAKSLSQLYGVVVKIEEVEKMLADFHAKGKVVRNTDDTYLSW
jgi:hypothetical protein